jgi:prolipoprotein diacylglyceryltransferase
MLVGLYIFARLRQKVHFWWYADRLAIAFPLGGIWIRLGNLMNSEIIGLPTDLPWGFVFVQVDGLSRHPVQLYEVLMLVCLFAFLLQRYLYRLEAFPLGRFVAWFFIWVPAIRFIIDFAKADEYWAPGLKTGQVLHIPFFLFGCLMWYASERRWLS